MAKSKLIKRFRKNVRKTWRRAKNKLIKVFKKNVRKTWRRAKNKLKKVFKKMIDIPWNTVNRILMINDFLKLLGIDISNIDTQELIDKIIREF